MRRLIVASHRGPLRVRDDGNRRIWVRAAGGLVTALDPVLRSRGGVWVSADEHAEHVEMPARPPDHGYEQQVVHLHRQVQDGFYQDISNAVLWPLLHGFPPTIRLGEAPWGSYVDANRAFADAVLKSSDAGDPIWLHDYHLMLTPSMIRDQRPSARVGWFCHVPWPHPEAFEILPWRGAILRGLVSADVLGFHTQRYVDNFLRCVARLTDCEVDLAHGSIQVDGRQVSVVEAPIGVPVEQFEALGTDPELQPRVEGIRRSLGGRRILLGVDRLDYTKGIVERLLAYERLLERIEDLSREHVYVQIMVPSRTDVQAYADLKAEVDGLVGHVNGRFGKTGQVPVHYLYRHVDQKELFAHYRAADVALVTPLRDGMNLVAHEYVVAQNDEDGVLVLSEFAGAAHAFTEAVIVNPYDIGGMAAAFELALRMSPSERQSRMGALRETARRMDVHRWASRFVSRLDT